MSIIDVAFGDNTVRVDVGTELFKLSRSGIDVMDDVLESCGGWSLAEIIVLLSLGNKQKQRMDDLVATTGMDKKQLDTTLSYMLLSGLVESRSMFEARRKEIIDAMEPLFTPDDPNPAE